MKHSFKLLLLVLEMELEQISGQRRTVQLGRILLCSGRCSCPRDTCSSSEYGRTSLKLYFFFTRRTREFVSVSLTLRTRRPLALSVSVSRAGSEMTNFYRILCRGINRKVNSSSSRLLPTRSNECPIKAMSPGSQGNS